MADVYNGQLDAFVLYHLHSESRSKSSGVALPALGHAISGAIGSAVSNVAVYPLDLIVTRLQSQRQLKDSQSIRYTSIPDAAQKIASEGGVSALYAGVVEDTAKTVADAFLFFLAYNAVRNSRTFQSKSALGELSVGFVAGAFSKLLTAPIANVVTRLQTSTKRQTAREVALAIRKEKGLLGFWSGYSASLVLTLNPSLTFFFFESFKKATKANGALATFLMAATSKALASSVTYPFSLAKARIQVSSKAPDEGEEKGKVVGKTAKAKNQTVFSTISRIAATEGPAALYEGLSGEVLKGFVNHGLTMMTKDYVHRLVIALYFAVLRLLRRHPEVTHAVSDAAQSAQNAVETAKGGVDSARHKAEAVAKEGIETVRDKAQEIGKDAGDAVEKVLDKVKSK